MNVNERINAIRKLMKEKGINVYYIPNEDDHLSYEYTAAHYHCKSYVSGFTGEAGCVVVTEESSYLFTDGRYFTQAEIELKGTEIRLMKMGTEGVPEISQFLINETKENGVLGFDGKVVSAKMFLKLKKELTKKNASVSTEYDLVNEIWEARPEVGKDEIFILEEKYVGESAEERIARVRKAMTEKGADVLLLTMLEDPCWMLNVRGNDIPCTPVAYAFAMVKEDEVIYYIDSCKVNAEVEQYLSCNGVTVKAYETIMDDLSHLAGKNVLSDLSTLNSTLYTAVCEKNTIIDEPSVVLVYRAIRNEVEIRNLRNAHVKDGVAMVKFIRYMKETINHEEMSECSAQDRLYALRSEQEEYIEPSFMTICAYQENGAMMHYSATEENHAKLKPEGFLLVDSGGTYRDGTTDITRTIALGKLTDEEKRYYTLVLKGHLALKRAVFLEGSTGQNLDILARAPMWQNHINYRCGTGHGVGHVLGVHEGIHGLRNGAAKVYHPAQELVEGMILTDEPGIYLPYELGVRIENELLVRKDIANEYGQWYHFEDVTYCPYEPEAIDLSLLSDEEIKDINAYHHNVYEVLSPRLTGEDLDFLKEVTKELSR